MNKSFRSTDLILKEIRNSDVTLDYLEWLNNSEINQYLESRFSYHDINSVNDFVDSCNKNSDVFLFGIFTIKDMKHIGNIKLGPINRNHLSADIGILIGDKSYWGKGLAKQAISLVLTFAFNDLNLEKICAGCYENNLASKRAFESSGFKVEGFLINQVVSTNGREGVWKLGCNYSDFLT